MSTIWTLFRATAVVAGSSAALLMGGLMGTAHADPAAPPIPAPNIGQQLVTSAAGAPQVLQNLATAMGGQPATPPPLASIRVPSPSEAALPGATSGIPGATSLIPGTAPAATTAAPGLGIPGLTPTVPAAAPATTPGLGIPGFAPTVPAAAPTTGPAGLLPQAQLNLPQLPFLGVPLPQQISLPGDLTSLMTGGVPASPGVASLPVSSPVTA
ncbi:hypothetical protein, partial [Mycobacterium sp.]|uniref:hypothetical protein n=1 Tax=Mycobacterium sp. TaxID=1785 RepID=UPI003C74944F